MSVSASTLRALAGRFLIALVVGSLLMAGAVAGVNEEIGNKIDRIPKIDLVTAPPRPGGANYLLVGSDSRAFVSNALEEGAFVDDTTDAGRRSDTIMVVHLEPEAERTFVLSFPRDLLVNIPGHGREKINAAYGYGDTVEDGAQTLIDTLKMNFDIDIQHFLELDFKTFVGLVNELGRVSVYVEYPARDEFTGLDIRNPGCVSLDGETSLQYVRSRALEWEVTPDNWVRVKPEAPDIGRIDRQQDFMRRLAGLAVQKSLGDPFTANVVADKVVGGLTADDAFDRASVFALIDAFRTLNPQDQSALEFATMPWKAGPLYNNQSVLYVDNDSPLKTAYLDRLRSFDDQTPPPAPPPSSIRVKVVNASGKPGLGVAMTAELDELGFDTVEPDEDGGERIPNTTVRVSLDQGKEGKLLLRYIEPTAELRVVGQTDVDVTLVLGKSFKGIVQPADAVDVTETTLPPPEDAEAPVEAAPTEPSTSLPPVSLSLPPAAPRGNC